MKLNAAGQKPTPGQHTESDGQGNTIHLDAYNETNYGFLRVTVSASKILVESLGITGTPTTTTPGTTIPPPFVVDSFSIDLTAHRVTTG
jgi:hypothetical protein